LFSRGEGQLLGIENKAIYLWEKKLEKKNVFFFLTFCCPQKVTKFCSKNKKNEEFKKKKTNFFSFFFKKYFFEKFLEKKKFGKENIFLVFTRMAAIIEGGAAILDIIHKIRKRLQKI